MKGFSQIILALWLLALTKPVLADIVWGPGLIWKTLSFRPLAEEDSQTITGYGVSLGLGVILADIFEGRINVDATKSHKGAANLYKADILVQSWVGEIGLRLEDAAFFGFYGGAIKYAVPSHHSHNQVVGEWTGTEFGIKLAGSWWAMRDQMMELSLRMSHGTVQKKGSLDNEKRKLDTIALTMTYLIIGSKYF